MTTLIATSIDNRVELLVNEAGVYWVQPVIGTRRFKEQVREVAGFNYDEATSYFDRIISRRLDGQLF